MKIHNTQRKQVQKETHTKYITRQHKRNTEIQHDEIHFTKTKIKKSERNTKHNQTDSRQMKYITKEEIHKCINQTIHK